MQATIRLEYLDQATAAAVASAVSPDNINPPEGLTVETSQEGNSVITEFCSDGKLVTLIATIDDLLEAASTAEKTLRIAKTK